MFFIKFIQRWDRLKQIRFRCFVAFVAILLLVAMAASAQSKYPRPEFDPKSPFILAGIRTGPGESGYKKIHQPLFSLLIDSIPCRTFTASFARGDSVAGIMADSVKVVIKQLHDISAGIKLVIRFTNVGKVARKIENLVPLGEGGDRVYITAAGSKEWPGYLCRSVLHRPGFGPIGVVLPDNAWHLGFTDLRINDTTSVVALARRAQRDKELSSVDRWAVTLKPMGWIEYAMYADLHQGDWHLGLSRMFRERFLYDLETFDNSLFRRTDLAWMKHKYIMLLQFAWDKKYYDYLGKSHTFYKSLFENDSLIGWYDIYTLWPTWPRLGLDQRNQWDMYRDLPGGLEELKKQAAFCHRMGKRYFISYNPWDEGTRKEDHFKGMEVLLRTTDADGVVLDTRGESSRELQATADKVRPGIVMYSEGMAVPRDMPGIVSGRVHDALVLPPPLNLNKFIKPEFAIFRVLQLADDRIHREVAISFFNGYGVEINTMKPGRPEWIAEEFRYLGKTTKILRENSTAFTGESFYPLVETVADSVYVNRWSAPGKTIYTIYSARPGGYTGRLFIHESMAGSPPVSVIPGDLRFIDLWNHREIKPVLKDGKLWITVETGSFDRAWLNSRREGNAGCIAVLNKSLHAAINNGVLSLKAVSGTRIIITPGDPFYGKKNHIVPPSVASVVLSEVFREKPEKWVVQLFDGMDLVDEVILPSGEKLRENQEKAPPEKHLAAGRPLPDPNRKPVPELVNLQQKTKAYAAPPDGMTLVPGGKFRFYPRRDPATLEPFIPFPYLSDTTIVEMKPFYIDIYPVTNSSFALFLQQSGYRPEDTTNYLRHWENGRPKMGEENFPVVWVSPEDAGAYAKWAGKRLPAEAEWQYSAQGQDGRKFPWGNEPDSTKCNFNLNHPTPVDKFPAGESPFGVRDLVGNVWQFTNELYDNGAYYFTVIRGGSFYHPTQSIWYVAGGPVPVDHPEMLLLVAPGLNRNATVGFRCVADTQTAR